MLIELIQEINKKRFLDYIHGFTFKIGSSFRRVVRWPQVSLHIIAIVISIPIIAYGGDWGYHLFFRNNIFFQIFLFPAVPLGGLIPFMLPPVIYLYGKKEKKPYLESLAFALTQAAVLGVFWSSIYKAITGRIGPEIFENIENDYSKEFAFGILRNGVFHGWPSAHTAIAWAMAVVLYYYRSEDKTINQGSPKDTPKLLHYKKYAFVYAFYIGFGVSTNIHWFSDAIAGALIGVSVGLSVTRTYSRYWKIDNQEQSNTRVIYLVFFIMFILIIFSFITSENLKFAFNK
ncbi:MAG: hypothetical protein HeimC2_28870 [Candidatus Heimdallarchaeota archaeon LC_2]|nr:MAG: hypothetical protein HeimC2_28870 [Candidatus Heimdallarchaeota archaeon LC_2]